MAQARPKKIVQLLAKTARLFFTGFKWLFSKIIWAVGQLQYLPISHKKICNKILRLIGWFSLYIYLSALLPKSSSQPRDRGLLIHAT